MNDFFEEELMVKSKHGKYELFARVRDMDTLFSRTRTDICLGNNNGKKALSELIDFCKSVASSGAFVLDMIDPAVMGAGPNIRVLMSACIAAYYSRIQRFSDRRADCFITSALLHDIGMSAISEQEDQTDLPDMTEHVMIGYKLLLSCADDRIDRDVRDVVLQHHERADGSGYPFGVKDGVINEVADVVGLIDLFLKIADYCASVDSMRNELERHRDEFSARSFKNFISMTFGDEL